MPPDRGGYPLELASGRRYFPVRYRRPVPLPPLARPSRVASAYYGCRTGGPCRCWRCVSRPDRTRMGRAPGLRRFGLAGAPSAWALAPAATRGARDECAERRRALDARHAGRPADAGRRRRAPRAVRNRPRLRGPPRVDRSLRQAGGGTRFAATSKPQRATSAPRHWSLTADENPPGEAAFP